MRPTHPERGATLIELVLAMVVVAIIVTAVSFFLTPLRQSTDLALRAELSDIAAAAGIFRHPGEKGQVAEAVASLRSEVDRLRGIAEDSAGAVQAGVVGKSEAREESSEWGVRSIE